MIDITIDIAVTPRGPGYCKLNNKHLDDENYVKIIQGVTQQTLENFRHLNADEMWEMLKFEWTKESKLFSRKCSYNRKVK